MSTSTDSDKYEICFVQINNASEEDKSKLELAYEAMGNHELDPKWIAEETCFQLKKKEAKLFVVNPFDGEVFKHLCKLGCRIVGPLCILCCLQLGETLPKRPHPVYNVSMRKITITCSNLDKATRLVLSERIQLMGGNFSKDLTKGVTHLVVGEVGSKKYHVAANFGLSIMLPSWVTKVWNDSQAKQVHASDAIYNEFRCPVFKGLSITISQLSIDERKRYKALIEENGGRYSGAMKSKDTTHLVLKEGKGEKYSFAKSWKLHCISPLWLDESITSGHCKDENLYKLSPNESFIPKRSTPVKDRSTERFSIDCSAIDRTLLGDLNETAQSEISIMVKDKPQQLLSTLEALDVSSLPKFGQFLDGCKIFLSGFKGADLEKLRKIINCGGGIRFSNYSESVSHVVCGDANNSQLYETIKTSTVKPHVVSLEWLLQCYQSGKLVDEAPFSCLDFDSFNLESELINKIENEKSNAAVQSKDLTLNSDFSDIFQQYSSVNKPVKVDDMNLGSISFSRMDNTTVEKGPNLTNGHKENTLYNNSSIGEANQRDVEVEAKQSLSSITTDMTLLPGETSGNNLFHGKTFEIQGFDENDRETISNIITSHAGTVAVPGNKMTDIAIVPLIWDNFCVSAKIIVTNCWLQKCTEENNFFRFDENELFQPFHVDVSSNPLQNVVISISQYVGTERDCLMHLAEILGAQCQEYFVKKANPSRGLLPNTHLIASTPEGSKYEASKKWKIPAVTKNWLITAAKSNSVPSVEGYLVGKAQKESTFFSEIVHLSPSNITRSRDTIVNGDAKSKSPMVDLKENVNCLGEVSLQTADQEKNLICSVSKNRIAKLINEGTQSSGVDSDISSPVSFLRKNYKPNFDVSGVFRAFELTPQSSKKKLQSPALKDVLTKNINLVVDAVRNEHCNISHDEIDQLNVSDLTSSKTTLKGVVLCVSKKLSSQQVRIIELVQSLGGDYRWIFDNNCTHYVFQGKTNDLTKEFREARRLRKHIVSPEWIYACAEAGARVDESAYPHTYKPSLSLSQISTSKSIAADASPISSKPTPSNSNNIITTRDVCKEVSNKAENTNVCEQLDQIIVAAKSARAEKRRARGINSSYDGSNERGSRRSSTASPIYTNLYSATDLKVHEHNNDAVLTEPSQSLAIVWDDPTGRMEREKIAATMSTANIHNNDEHQMNGEDDMALLETEKLSDQSLKKFMFTSLPDVEKEHYSTMVTKLGGEVSYSGAFDETATHVILGQPIKNEKFLASVASGKWVLHKSYLDDSHKNNKFLSEGLYEWGSQDSHFLQSYTGSSLKIAMCATRWRKKLQSSNSGAFQEWKVTVIAHKKKIQSLTNILKVGGAEVYPISSLQPGQELTHAFVEAGSDVSRLEPFISSSLHCVKLEYLAFYLIDDPPPPVSNYLAPEINNYKNTANSSNSSKRRVLSDAMGTRKRSRIS